jgi:basic membrane protein A
MMKKLHIVLVVILSLVFGALSPMAFAVEAGTVYEYKYEDILELLKGSASKSVSITKGKVLGQEIGKTDLQGVYKAMGIPVDGIVKEEIKVAVYEHKDIEFDFYFDKNELLAGIWIKEAKYKEIPEGVSSIFAGLVTDTGGINDFSFNQMTWQGIDRFAKDNGIDPYRTAYIEPNTQDDVYKNMITLVNEGSDIIVAPGFLMNEAVNNLSELYPEQKILLLDSIVDRSNVCSAVFAEEEGSFLVGVAAGLKARELKSNKVAFVGGMDFPLIRKFEAGFEAGVKAVDPNIQVLVNYADTFIDYQVGQNIASVMYDEGVSVIYHAAGAVGVGIIGEARTRTMAGNEVYVIGVDVDSYSMGIYENNKSVVLTSMVKNLDEAVYQVLDKVNKNTFKGGVVEFGLARNGVGIPKNNPNLSDEIVKSIADYRAKIISGEIVVPVEPERNR